MCETWSRSHWVLGAGLLLVHLVSGSAAAQDDDGPAQEMGLPELPAQDEGSGATSRRRRSEESGPRFLPASRHPDALPPSQQQTQILGKGLIRVELGPPDFALLDSGFVSEGRGLRVGRAELNDVSAPGTTSRPYVGLGVGASYGVANNLELGLLALPLLLTNGLGEYDFGNMEAHGRMGVFKGDTVELAAQLTLQIPTNLTFGVGVGLPLRVLATESLVVDTGIELEIAYLFPKGSPSQTFVNLDIPVAVNYFITPELYAGGRLGFFVLDMGGVGEVFFSLGGQAGFLVADRMVNLMAWFQWAAIPLGEFRYVGKSQFRAFEPGSFEGGLGATITFGPGS